MQQYSLLYRILCSCGWLSTLCPDEQVPTGLYVGKTKLKILHDKRVENLV